VASQGWSGPVCKDFKRAALPLPRKWFVLAPHSDGPTCAARLAHFSCYTPLPSYHRHLADEFLAPVFRPRGSRSSSLSVIIIIRRTQLSTVSDRAFPVAAAARVWNALPRHVTSARRPSCEFSDSRLKIHLFSRSFSDFVWRP